jgi:hypothetical protein
MSSLIAGEFTAQIGRHLLEHGAPVACGGLAIEFEGWIARTVLRLCIQPQSAAVQAASA